MPMRQTPQDYFRQKFDQMVTLAKDEIQTIQAQPAPQFAQPAYPVPALQQPPTEDKTWKILLVVGLVVLGIAILGFLAFLKSSDHRRESSLTESDLLRLLSKLKFR